MAKQRARMVKRTAASIAFDSEEEGVAVEVLVDNTGSFFLVMPVKGVTELKGIKE